MTLPVIYEDAHLFAINKPYGIAVHKVSPTDPQITVADMLVAERPYLAGVGESPLRPGIVHRLDKETSGIMVIAKDQPTFEYLKNLFQTRQTQKEYLALVHGRPAQASGTIDAPLGKLGTKQTTQIKGKRELVVRDAVTDYEVLRSYPDYTLVRAMPKTGRTHQIRVHLKHIGCPLAGDKLYAAKKPLPPGLERLFLHAWKLRLTSPDGKALALEADLPQDLQKTLDMLESSGV
ncbi:MAG: RluA family pseudouridine synthase [Candidatus Yanofskybacteria bacterium]|nr:RluA family pseudouridine synthase [Candidatus Yanofskybacteria bacterium]